MLRQWERNFGNRGGSLLAGAAFTVVLAHLRMIPTKSTAVTGKPVAASLNAAVLLARNASEVLASQLSIAPIHSPRFKTRLFNARRLKRSAAAIESEAWNFVARATRHRHQQAAIPAFAARNSVAS